MSCGLIDYDYDATHHLVHKISTERNPMGLPLVILIAASSLWLLSGAAYTVQYMIHHKVFKSEPPTWRAKLTHWARLTHIGLEGAVLGPVGILIRVRQARLKLRGLEKSHSSRENIPEHSLLSEKEHYPDRRRRALIAQRLGALAVGDYVGVERLFNQDVPPVPTARTQQELFERKVEIYCTQYGLDELRAILIVAQEMRDFENLENPEPRDSPFFGLTF